MTPETRLLAAVLIGVAVVLWAGGRPPILVSRSRWSRWSRRSHRNRGVWHQEVADAGPREDAKSSVGCGGSRPPARADLGDVAATCDLLALALAAGSGVEEALEAVAHVGPPATRDALGTIVAGRQWGLPADGVAAALAPGWAPVLRAVRLAESAGVAPSGPLAQTAADLRAGRAHRLELAIAKLRVSIVLPLGLCFLPAFVLTTVVPVVLALATHIASP